MNVNLRKRKQGKSNKVALYLDIYKGRTVDANGKTKYLRTYEHLNMFIYDNPKTNSDKLHNKKIMQIAKNIKNKRELEIYSGRYGIKTDTDCKNTNFYEYYCGLAENYKLESSCWRSWKSSCQILKEFAGENITFAEIDENFCERYLRHIQNKTSMHNRSLKNTSINYYFRRFVYAIKCAVKDKIIKENPATNVKLLKVKKTEPVYLTFEELQTLIKTDCKDSLLKRMFIFSCLTGLRWGDVYKLTWSEIEETQGKCSIVFKQQKTQETNYLPLSEQALNCSSFDLLLHFRKSRFRYNLTVIFHFSVHN